METKRKFGRTQKRWLDVIKRMAGRNWMQTTQDRMTWKALGPGVYEKREIRLL